MIWRGVFFFPSGTHCFWIPWCIRGLWESVEFLRASHFSWMTQSQLICRGGGVVSYHKVHLWVCACVCVSVLRSLVAFDILLIWRMFEVWCNISCSHLALSCFPLKSPLRSQITTETSLVPHCVYLCICVCVWAVESPALKCCVNMLNAVAYIPYETFYVFV